MTTRASCLSLAFGLFAVLAVVPLGRVSGADQAAEGAGEAAKAAVPDAAANKVAMKLVRELFKDDIANAKKPEDANLIIRPGVNWEEGHRYIVALRNLKTKDGKVIKAAPEFAAYRDRKKTTDKPTLQPVNKPTGTRFSHVVRGGSWMDEADKCRSAARVGST